MRKGYVSPSLMCVDLMNVQSDIEKLEKVGVDYFHVDMMDNHFVPNITLSTDFIKALKKISKTPLDIHMMIEHPEQTIPELTCCDENDIICIHYESTLHPQKVLASIRAMGVKAGIAINPATPVCVLEDILPDVDMVLCMTVNPGFAGRDYLHFVEPKIEQLLKLRQRYKFDIVIDGGVIWEILERLWKKGVEGFVLGKQILFEKNEDYRTIIQKVRNI